MNRLGSWLVVACAALLCACGDCSGELTPAKRAQQPLPDQPATPATSTEGTDPRRALELPEGTPIDTDLLQRFAPDSIADWKARAPVDAQTMPLGNGGALTRVHRGYARGEQRLELEISDTLHAPALRKMVESQQGLERSTGKKSFRGMPIAGQPALVQWFGANHLALVNVLVRSRILVNIKVTPADDVEDTVKIAGTLPLEKIGDLIDNEDGAGEPTAPAEPGAPTQQRPPAKLATPPAG